MKAVWGRSEPGAPLRDNARQHNRREQGKSDRQGDEDLVGGVAHGGQGVGGEDRQGDAFGQEGFAEGLAGDRAPNKDPSEAVCIK